MDDEKRVRLAIGLIFLVMLGWMVMSRYLYPPPPDVPSEETSQAPAAGHEPGLPPDEASRKGDLAAADSGADAQSQREMPIALPAQEQAPERLLLIDTPLVRAQISTRGARLTQWELTKYFDDSGKAPYEMVSQVFTESPLATKLSTTTGQMSDAERTFSYEGPERLTLSQGQERTLTFRWSGPPGIVWTRDLRFSADTYAVTQTDRIEPLGAAAPSGPANLEVQTRLRPPKRGEKGQGQQGPLALLSAQGKLQQEAASELYEDKLTLSSDPLDGWMGVGLPYFLFAWVPETAALGKASIEAPAEGELALRLVLPERRLEKGIEETLSLFLGPKDRERIEAFGHGLGAALDFGFFASIARALLWVLLRVDRLVGDYGWSIIVLTILVRLLMFPLSIWQFKSMRAMQHIQPLMKDLREKYKGDAQRQQQEMMNLYRQHKVNPFGGCLPMLAQLPIFLGLYMALLNAIELRQSPWGGTWITDLSLKDPYYILPVLMTGSTYFSMRLTPNPTADSAQKKMMQFMPLIFFFFFLNMPAGLMLYWSVSNVLSIGQQLYINRAAKSAEGVAHPSMLPEPEPIDGTAALAEPAAQPDTPARRRRRRRGKR